MPLTSVVERTRTKRWSFFFFFLLNSSCSSIRLGTASILQKSQLVSFSFFPFLLFLPWHSLLFKINKRFANYFTASFFCCCYYRAWGKDDTPFFSSFFLFCNTSFRSFAKNGQWTEQCECNNSKRKEKREKCKALSLFSSLCGRASMVVSAAVHIAIVKEG